MRGFMVEARAPRAGSDSKRERGRPSRTARTTPSNSHCLSRLPGRNERTTKVFSLKIGTGALNRKIRG
jgi:hypothetical protein